MGKCYQILTSLLQDVEGFCKNLIRSYKIIARDIHDMIWNPKRFYKMQESIIELKSIIESKMKIFIAHEMCKILCMKDMQDNLKIFSRFL